MTKREFSEYVEKIKAKTKQDYLDIILELVNDEDYPVFYENINLYIENSLRSKLFFECKNKNLLKNEYTLKLFETNQLMG